MDAMRARFAPVVSRLLDEDPRVAVVLAEIGKTASPRPCAATPTG